MRYWDASALLPLEVNEPGTELVREWLGEDPQVVTWSWSQVELTSAVERRTREGRLTPSLRRGLLRRISLLAHAWDEIDGPGPVRKRALKLLARHPLRAIDAGHLACALVASEDEPASLPFVCLDKRLAEAAEREGFTVLTWPDAG